MGGDLHNTGMEYIYIRERHKMGGDLHYTGMGWGGREQVRGSKQRDRKECGLLVVSSAANHSLKSDNSNTLV